MPQAKQILGKKANTLKKGFARAQAIGAKRSDYRALCDVLKLKPML